MNKTRIRFFPRIRPRRGKLQTQSSKGQRYCPNCHYPLPHYGEFCSNCGQRYTDGRVPLKFLLQDFLDSVLNIDSKFFRTSWALLIPGKLTNEFFKGHHKRFASPGRLFFVATVVHFAVLGFVINGEVQEELGQFVDKNRRRAYEVSIRDSLLQAQRDIIPLYDDDPEATAAVDSLIKRVVAERRDTQILNYIYIDQDWSIQNKSVSVSQEDLYNMQPSELADAYHIEGGMERLVFQQVVKIMTHVDNFTQFAIGQLVWMVILMMPALALILKLLYVRRKRYFVEHLVFSFHYHAFAFWVVSIGLIIGIAADSQSIDFDMENFIFPALLIILVYLFVAMRRVYRQGFFKTFFKFSFLNFSYVFLFFAFLTMTLAVSVLLF